jgi:hypothetical protein
MLDEEAAEAEAATYLERRLDAMAPDYKNP